MMRRLIGNSVVPALLTLAVAAAACSKGSSTSPVAPTALSPAGSAPVPAPLSGGATVSGMVVTGATSTPAPLGLAFPGAATLAGAGRVTISVNGSSISATSDDAGNFVLQNVPPGAVTLTITGSGFSAQITLPAVNVNDTLRVTVRVNGSTATLDDDEVESADKLEIEGTIGSVSGLSSSGGTIVVGRLNTAVLVTSATSITKGSATLKPNDLMVGLRVHVRAAKSGSTLTATTVIVQNTTPDAAGGNGKSDDDDDDEADDDRNEAEFSGTIAGAPTGSCATALTFMAGSTKVTTKPSTKFENVTCATLASGDFVKGEGTRQTDGSVLASEVEKVTSGSGGSGRR
ncbi:MAG TPA: DUF5666 domain-containing protein [Vicinamibacterales bacterium]|nr:DUF5666 domain-containing protein [Vicinamibacterales bacterium]